MDEIAPDSPRVPHENLITFVKDRPGHDFRYDMDFSKIQEELGWEPVVDLEDGLRETVNWYLSSTKWMDAIKEGSDFREWVHHNYEGRGNRPG